MDRIIYGPISEKIAEGVSRFRAALQSSHLYSLHILYLRFTTDFTRVLFPITTLT